MHTATVPHMMHWESSTMNTFDTKEEHSGQRCQYKMVLSTKLEIGQLLVQANVPFKRWVQK